MALFAKFGKSTRYFIGAAVIFLVNILCASMLSYDALTREHMSLLNMAVIVFYAVVPLFLCSLWYDWCYYKEYELFTKRLFLKRGMSHIFVWLFFCATLFDEKFPIIAVLWAISAVYIMQLLQLRILGFNMSLKAWSLTFFLGKRTMKNTYSPMLACLIATLVYSINAYFFWISSPFYIWWINNSIAKSVDIRIESALQNEGSNHV